MMMDDPNSEADWLNDDMESGYELSTNDGKGGGFGGGM